MQPLEDGTGSASTWRTGMPRCHASARTSSSRRTGFGREICSRQANASTGGSRSVGSELHRTTADAMLSAAWMAGPRRSRLMSRTRRSWAPSYFGTTSWALGFRTTESGTSKEARDAQLDLAQQANVRLARSVPPIGQHRDTRKIPLEARSGEPAHQAAGCVLSQPGSLLIQRLCDRRCTYVQVTSIDRIVQDLSVADGSAAPSR